MPGRMPARADHPQRHSQPGQIKREGQDAPWVADCALRHDPRQIHELLHSCLCVAERAALEDAALLSNWIAKDAIAALRWRGPTIRR